MKLGKQPARHDDRTLKLRDYALAPGYPTPAVATWGHKGQNWPVLGNDRYGDCVFAGIYHQIEAWRMNRGGWLLGAPSTADALAAYSAVTGFNPAVPSTDQGTNMLDAMNYWRSSGLPWTAMNYWRGSGVPGHARPVDQIDGYASISNDSTAEIRLAISEFGGCLLGAAMPLDAQAQTSNGRPWQPTPGAHGVPGSWGGHCVYAVGYDAVNVAVITWGRVQLATWQWITTYVDEAYAVLALDWYGNSGGITPGKINVAQLRADIGRIS